MKAKNFVSKFTTVSLWLIFLLVHPISLFCRTLSATDEDVTDAWSSVDFSWTNCGSASDSMEITSLSVAPDVLTRGAPMTVAMAGVVNSPIVKGATIMVKVHFEKLLFFERTMDLCQSILDTKDKSLPKCPIHEEPFSISHSDTLPRPIPKVSTLSFVWFHFLFFVVWQGNYFIDLVAKNANMSQIFCLKCELKVSE